MSCCCGGGCAGAGLEGPSLAGDELARFFAGDDTRGGGGCAARGGGIFLAALLFLLARSFAFGCHEIRRGAHAAGGASLSGMLRFTTALDAAEPR